MLNTYVIYIYRFMEKISCFVTLHNSFMLLVLRINRYIYSLRKGKFFVQQFV